MDAPCLIRPALDADVPGLAAIERRAFPDPWSEASFREAVTGPGAVVLIAEAGGKGAARGSIAGYVIGRALAGAGEILNLAVDEPFRRRGIARDLLDLALDRLQHLGAGEVFLEVRESNVAARLLYASRGFHPVGMRRAYYRSPKEDAVVLRRVPGRGA